MRIHLISLGCSKNLVDSETLTGLLATDGHTFTGNIIDAEVIILNTCSFIGASRLEAKRHIRNILNLKDKKTVFLVTGCLPQIEKDSLLKQFSSINAIFGSSDFIKIPNYINNSSNPINPVFVSSPAFLYNSSYCRPVSTGSYAYLKIAEGCDNRCSYCLIPSIRGNYRERKIEDIAVEAKKLTDTGIKELILISQDTTSYGTRIYGKRMLHKLIRKLVKIPSLEWLRILYTHPGHFTDELIDTVAGTEKTCKYIDIPVQHTHDEILEKMNRPGSKTIFSTIDRIRKKIPRATLRTTIMTGFPGETEKHFNKLLRDIKNLEFDWLGCFRYSKQRGTAAYSMLNQVSPEVKKERYDRIMSLQQKITLRKNENLAGKVYEVLADSPSHGHAEFQAPEIDGKILLSCARPNSFVRVKITGIKNIYDLKGMCIGKK